MLTAKEKKEGLIFLMGFILGGIILTLYYFGLFNRMSWSVFVPTFLATAIGVGIAFILNKKYGDKLEKRDSIRLLELLKDEIDHDKSLLIELKDYFQKGIAPFYDLQFNVWESISSRLFRILKNSELLKDLARYYFELQHIERKINKQFDLAFGRDDLTETGQESYKKIVGGTLAHIPNVLMGKSCKSPDVLLNEIDHEIYLLSR